ncbi:type I-G CRISPR-associated protein Csb2 [Fontivita pretiosa]|uniref:type I-G CRISPR-associated protein Csb2 n=1 Tax=Fontivita pretiosa TaxID=2989684 RepID=UPI003D183162
MTRHLCISVTLLDPLFHGKWDDEQPEWPPSPMRLFQALVAGSRSGCRNGDWSAPKADAFRWLECQPPPIIIAPPQQKGQAYTLFVPNNDADKKFERQERLTSKIVTPRLLLNGQSPYAGPVTLHYLWPIREPDWQAAEKHARILCREARNLMALGWGIDQAIGNGQILTNGSVAQMTGQRWEPWLHAPASQPRLRVPRKGSLQDIERAYQAFIGRVFVERKGRRAALRYMPPDKARCFDMVAYFQRTTIPQRPYAVFELPDGVAFRQEDASVVAAMLRSLACREKEDFSERFPDDNSEVYLSGHVNGARKTPPRFSYLPLPSIGHEHSDGMIRRVLIAEPFGGDGRRAAWAQGRLLNQTLTDASKNHRGQLMNLWRKTSRSVVDRYVGSVRTWATVTPVILPGFDDFRGVTKDEQRAGQATKTEQLFMKAVVQAGLPADLVESFALRKAPFWPGSAHPSRYRRPDYLDTARDRHFPAWHVCVRFRESVPGPIAIGAGRHCGLGLFAAKEG